MLEVQFTKIISILLRILLKIFAPSKSSRTAAGTIKALIMAIDEFYWQNGASQAAKIYQKKSSLYFWQKKLTAPRDANFLSKSKPAYNAFVS